LLGPAALRSGAAQAISRALASTTVMPMSSVTRSGNSDQSKPSRRRQVMPPAGGWIAKFVIPFRGTDDKLTPILFPPSFIARFASPLNPSRVAPDPFENLRQTS